MPPHGACYAVELPYQGIIEATSSASNISKFNINAFVGFTTTSALTFNALKKSWYQAYTIESSDASVRAESVVLEAVDASGLSGAQRSYLYLLNFLPPRFTRIDGLGKICTRDSDPVQSTSFELVVRFNRPVVKPLNASKARMYFVNRADNSVVHSITTSQLSDLDDAPSSMIRVNVLKSYFKPNQKYSVLFDFGAFEVEQYCRPQTDLVKDTERFTFDYIDDSVVVKYQTQRNEILNGNGSVKWSINEGQVESCFIKDDSQTAGDYQKFNCSGRNEFPMASFGSGLYSFYISYITPCLKLLKYSSTLNFR